MPDNEWKVQLGAELTDDGQKNIKSQILNIKGTAINIDSVNIDTRLSDKVQDKLSNFKNLKVTLDDIDISQSAIVNLVRKINGALQGIQVPNIDIFSSKINSGFQTGNKIATQYVKGFNDAIQKGNLQKDFYFSADKQNDTAKEAQKYFQSLSDGIVTVREDLHSLGDNAEASLTGFVITVKNAIGEVETLKYLLNNITDDDGNVTGQYFKYFGGTINDSNAVKQYEELLKIVTDYQVKLDNLKTKYSNADIDYSGFEKMFNGFKLGIVSANDLKVSFNQLENSAKSAVQNLKSQTASLDPVQQTLNNMRDFPSMLKTLQSDIDGLRDKSSLAGISIAKLETTFSELNDEMTNSDGKVPFTVEWTEKYRYLMSTITSVIAQVEALKKAEASDNSLVTKQANYYSSLMSNYREIYSLQERLLVSGEQESEVIESRLRSLRASNAAIEKQLQLQNLKDTDLDSDVDDLRKELDWHYRITEARQEDKKITEDIASLERNREQSLREQERLINAMAKGRESSEVKRLAQEEKEAIAQQQAINRSIEENYRQQIANENRTQQQRDDFNRRNLNAIDLEILQREEQGKYFSALLQEQMRLESENQKQRDNFNKRNLNAIDLEIKRREESGKQFSVLLQEQMQQEQQQYLQQEEIQYRIDTKQYELDIAKVENRINALKKTTKDVVVSSDELRRVYGELQNSSGDKRIEKEREFLVLLKRTTNELGIAQSQAKEYIDEFKKTNLSNDIRNWLENNTAATREAKAVLESYLNEVNSGNITPFREKEIRTGLKTIEADMRSLGRLGKSLPDTIISGAKSFLEWTVASVSIMEIIGLLKQVAENVYEIDTAMIELNKVSNESIERMNQSLNTSIKTAKEYGASVQDVINATSDWKRLGYSLDDSEYLAQVATVYKNVGDGIDMDTASKSLTSTLQGFGLQVKDAMNIVDQFNEVANNFPIDTAGIGEALQRSAASFNAANTDLSKSIALIATTNSVVQDPSTVGTMWKTVSMRIRGAKAELEEAGEDTEGMVESTAKLRDMIQGMTGFDIMKDEDTFKDIYEIVLGIGEKWQDLSDIEQASLLEALAGKRQGNALSAALNNVDMLKEAYETATDATGSAMKEQETYLNSLAAKTQQFEASIQSLSNTVLSSDLLKFFVDLGTKGVSSIDSIIQEFGVLSSLLTVGAGVLSTTGHGFVNYDQNAGFITLFDKLNKTVEITPDVKTALEKLSRTELSLGETVESLGEKVGITSEDFFNFAMKANLTGDVLSQYQDYIKHSTSLTAKFGNVLKTVGASLASMAIQFAVTKVIELAIEKYDEFANRIDNARDIMDESIDSYKTITDELSTLESQIKTTSERLSELQSAKAGGEIVDENELNKLTEERKELEAEIELLKQRQQLEASVAYNDSKNWYSETTKANSGYDTSYNQNSVQAHITASSNDMGWYHYDDAAIEKNKNNINFLLGAYDGLREKREQNKKSISEETKALDGKNDLEKESILENIDAYENQIAIIDQSRLTINKYIEEMKTGYQDFIQSYDTKVSLGDWAPSDEDTQTYNDAKLVIEAINQALTDNIALANEATIANTNNANSYEKYVAKTKTEVIAAVNGLSSGFESLDKIMASQKDDDPFDFSLLAEKDFTETFGKLGKEYTDFVEIVSSSPKDINACKDAYDSLLTKWIYSSGVLDGLSEDTARVTEAMLKNMGVANASEVVSNALTQEKAEMSWQTRETTEALVDEILSLRDENHVLDDGEAKWAAYIAQKMLDEVYNGTGDVWQLKTVMATLGLGVEAWEAYYIAKNKAMSSQGDRNYSIVDEGTSESYEKVDAKNSQKYWKGIEEVTFQSLSNRINAYIDDISTDMTFDGSIKSNSTSSSSDKDKNDEIDWIARKNELLQKQHDIQEQIANDETVSYNERKAALLDLIEKDKTLAVTAEESAEKYKQAWLEASADLTASDRAKIANESDNMNIEKYDAKDLLKKGIVSSLEDGEKYIENLKKSIKYYDLWKEYEQTAVDKKKEGTEHQKNSIRLLKEEIDHQKDLNAAIADQVTSRQELMEAQGKYINTGTYEELIRLSKEEESLHQDSIDTLYEELDLADEYTSEWYGILAEIESAENAITQCKIQQEELNDKIKRLPIDRIQMFRDMYAQIVEDMDNYMSIQASMGLKPTKEELQQYIDLYNEQIDSALKQQNKLKDLLTNYEYGSEKFNNTSQEIQDLDNEISSLLTNINEMNHQILQIPIQEMSEQIENLASAKATLERSIAEDNEKGLVTTISQYEKLNQLTLQQLQALSKQKNALVGLLSVYDENSDKYADIKSQIDSVSQSISDLVIQQYQWNSEILQIPSDKLEDLNNNLQTYSSILDASLSEMDSVLSGVIGVIEQQTDAIEEQRKASEEMYDERIERIEKEKELLTSTNNDRKLQLDYEQALYDLDRAKSQKSIQVVRDGKLDYEADQDAIRDAHASKADAEFNLTINNLEKQIEALEAEKETILEGYDEQLDKLDEVKNKWSEIAEQIQQAADIAKADEFFGDGWADKVLLGTDSDIFNLFKDLYSSTSEQRDSINEQITSNERLVQMMGEFVERYKEGSLTYDNALINISNLIQSMEGGYSALENLSDMMNLDNILGLENITTSTQAQIDKSAELLEQYMQIVESNKQSVEGFETNWDSMSGSVNSTIDAFNNAVNSMQTYLDVFNNNADAIKDNTSTWEEIKDNIESQVEALKKAAEELEKLANTQKVSSGSSNSNGSGSGSSSKGGTYLTVNGTSYLETSNGYVDKNTGNSGGSVAEVIGKYGSEKEKEDYYELRKNQISNSPQSKNEGWEKAALEALDKEMEKAGVIRYHDGIKNGPVDGKMSDDQLWDYARKIALDPLRADEVVKILQKGEGVFQPDQIRNVMQNSELVGRMSADASAIGAVTNMSRNNTIDCSIGQVHLHEIKDVDEFANAMKQTFASSMRQNFTEIFKK